MRPEQIICMHTTDEALKLTTLPSEGSRLSETVPLQNRRAYHLSADEKIKKDPISARTKIKP